MLTLPGRGKWAKNHLGCCNGKHPVSALIVLCADSIHRELTMSTRDGWSLTNCVLVFERTKTNKIP